MTKLIELDENLVKEALALGRHSTINVLVETALKDYINKHKKEKIIELFGIIEYEENYDYKKQRNIQ